MISRRACRGLVVLAALITVALGLFTAVRSAPALHGEWGDSVSALQLADHSAVLAPERRAPRPHVITPIDSPVTVLGFEIAGLVALIALATGRLAAPDDRLPPRDGWFPAWSLRGPPARARVTLTSAS